MFTHKQSKGISSCSSPSLSSLSDIALRNRTVSRDCLLSLSENGSVRDVLPYITSSDSSIPIVTKKKKNGGKKVPLRKIKKGKGSISKKSKLELKDTMVIAPFHALKESFQKQLNKLCCKKIDVTSEEDLDKELRSILNGNVKRKKRNRKKCQAPKARKRVTNSESSSSVILEEVQLNNGRSKSKAKSKPRVPKKMNKKARPQKKKKMQNRPKNSEQFLHKKNPRNNSNMKRKIQKDSIRTYNTRLRARLAGENAKKNNLIEISLDNDLDNSKETQFENSNPDENNDESNPIEPPCIILHPYDPSKRQNEKIISDDSEDDSDNVTSEEKATDISPSTEEKKTERADKTDELDKIETAEEGKIFTAVEPLVIIREHYNEPSSAEFSISDDEREEEVPNIFDNQIGESMGFSCGLQESNLPSYVFGQRNDFSRLRESCEYSFGLARTENDEQSDVGDFH